MNKAYKFRIYPDKAQQELINKTFGCVRFVYNKMLGEKIDYYKETEKFLKVTPAKYKAEFEFLKEVDSLALANAQLNLETAYKNFFRNKSTGFPKFKSKHNDRKSYTTNCVNNNICIEGNTIKLPKLGFVRIKKHRDIPEGYILKNCTITQKPSGKYFVSILFAYEQSIELVEPANTVGLHFSMSKLYVSSDGEVANNPRYYRRSLKKLKKLQRRLSNMKKGSNNYYKQKQLIAVLHELIANQRKDFLHKTSRQIANAYDLVAIEDLNMQAMSKALNFGKSVHDNGWGMFTSFLAYKLAEIGKHLIKVDKWFPSSKICSVCGTKKDELALSERIFVCDCENILDRDINAAINVKHEGMRVFGIA